jgi:hypothetical protein
VTASGHGCLRLQIAFVLALFIAGLRKPVKNPDTVHMVQMNSILTQMNSTVGKFCTLATGFLKPSINSLALYKQESNPTLPRELDLDHVQQTKTHLG